MDFAVLLHIHSFPNYSLSSVRKKDMNHLAAATCGIDRGAGNLLGIQPVLTPQDYRTEGAFLARLQNYLDAAAEQGWLSDRTIAVFPEHIGTWLAAADGPEAVFRATTIRAAMTPLLLRHAIPFASAWFSARETDRVSAALFRMRAMRIAEIYQSVFSQLARYNGITLVAGSLLLPEPKVIEGRIMAGSGPLYNMSAVFKPDGQVYDSLVRKVYPVREERVMIAAAPIEELPVFETPAGRLGVMVCADCWYPEPYAKLREAGVDLLAVPSFAAGHSVWDQPWRGYDGAPMPADVDAADVGRLTLGQAWGKYALAGRIATSAALCGVKVFLRGRLWDLGGDSGISMGICGDEVAAAGCQESALLNVWIP